MSWDIDVTRCANHLREHTGEEINFLSVDSPKSALRWAETAWLGFGEESPAPREFREFALACSSDSALRLVVAANGNRDIGSFIMTLPPDRDGAGIYYFSVIPEFRRRGAATAMMLEAGRAALSSKKCGIILQATPTGALFYSHFGFNALFEIPLFSTDNDVF